MQTGRTLQTRFKEEIFYNEGGETLAQVAQRGGGCSTPGNIQDLVGRSLSNLVQLKMSLLIAGGLGLDELYRFLPAPTFL